MTEEDLETLRNFARRALPHVELVCDVADRSIEYELSEQDKRDAGNAAKALRKLLAEVDVVRRRWAEELGDDDDTRC